jgi:hypothetical protein
LGYLAEINDSVLLLSSTELRYNPVFPDNKDIKSFNYKDFSSIKIRRTVTTGRRILIGTASCRGKSDVKRKNLIICE